MTESGTTEPFIARLGERVRRRRKAAGMTMEQLAVAADVSRRMLGQIELGEANPSLVTVGKIARALGIDFASLARDADRTGRLSSSAHPVDIWASKAGSRGALAVASTLKPAAELWDWTLQPGDAYEAEADPPGSEELFLVIAGRLTLCAEGVDPVILETGSSARLSTDRTYSYRNDTDRPTRFVRVAHVAG